MEIRTTFSSSLEKIGKKERKMDGRETSNKMDGRLAVTGMVASGGGKKKGRRGMKKGRKTSALYTRAFGGGRIKFRLHHISIANYAPVMSQNLMETGKWDDQRGKESLS